MNNKVIPIIPEHFQEIPLAPEKETTNKTIAFIDGGQAEILSGGNINLSFIRVFAHVMNNNTKISSFTEEFYILTNAVYRQGEICYESKLFSTGNGLLVEESDLIISSTDASIRSGNERAPISKVANMARRFAELKLAQKISADYILLDGTLEPTFKNEEKYIAALGSNVAALAKTCSLFTTCGNSPVVLLQKLSPYAGCWYYDAGEQNYFVKLHPQARHIFRFQGNSEILPHLVPNSSDPLFLGYPYGLILADKLARVSNAEKNSLKMNFLLRNENREVAGYLAAMDAHEILDRLG